MKLKINKACDLSSISVLPPQSRKLSGASGGLESSSLFGRSQTVSQLQTQSQQALSQGASSQHGLFSQFSQNSQEEILTNEKVGSQERENSVRRRSSLPPINYTREESQMVSRASNNSMRKWSGQEYKCHTSEELEHRIGMIETSLSRFGLILDSVQGDIMLANKGSKEIALETKDIRQKLNAHDDSLQSMSKGQEDIKACLGTGLKSLSEQVKQILSQENSGLIISSLSALSEKIDTQMVKLQNDLHKEFCKEIQTCAISYSMKMSTQKQASPSILGTKAVNCHATPQQVQFPKQYIFNAPEPINNSSTKHLKSQQTNLLPKIEVGGWTSVKQEKAVCNVGNLNQRSKQKKGSPLQSGPQVIESDEEIDGGFSCLFVEKGTEVDKYSAEEAERETARILRKARRKKRKYSNTIIIN